jgi:nitrogen PTS system EIIA component
MQLDVHAAAAALNVPESTIYRWVGERKLPANGIEGQYRFGRAELLEWATAHHLNVSSELFRGSDQESVEPLMLGKALTAGGIHYDVPAADKQQALRSVVELMHLPRQEDADLLLQLFLAREALGSTAVGNGIAIPHPRHPLVLPVSEPMLSLCFLARPIEFGAANREPVHTLFVLVSPTVPMHLQMLSRVASLLRDERFGQFLLARKGRKELLAEVRRVEASLEREDAKATSARMIRAEN